jgi:hypothetical protein
MIWFTLCQMSSEALWEERILNTTVPKLIIYGGRLACIKLIT